MGSNPTLSATNGARIATNGARIATNGARIATNGARIATNGARIATNGAQIAYGRTPRCRSANTSKRAWRSTTPKQSVWPVSRLARHGITFVSA
ncbi:MAG: hypothetical protein HYX54_06455 [Chloroflexi bacterium]|nr:hypothetical protein [Chloroflexota bacterium]